MDKVQKDNFTFFRSWFLFYKPTLKCKILSHLSKPICKPFTLCCNSSSVPAAGQITIPCSNNTNSHCTAYTENFPVIFYESINTPTFIVGTILFTISTHSRYAFLRNIFTNRIKSSCFKWRLYIQKATEQHQTTQRRSLSLPRKSREHVTFTTIPQ
jgi:hypothetical protein